MQGHNVTAGLGLKPSSSASKIRVVLMLPSLSGPYGFRVPFFPDLALPSAISLPHSHLTPAITPCFCSPNSSSSSRYHRLPLKVISEISDLGGP